MMSHCFSIRNILLSGAVVLACAGSAAAQSLPVEMPMEERLELQQYEREYVAGIDASGRQAIPLGRSSVAAMQQDQASSRLQAQTLANQGGYEIKAGSFLSFENAKNLRAKLYAIGPSRIEPRRANGMDFYGVYLGPWKDEADAFTAFSMALDAGMQDGEIIEK